MALLATFKAYAYAIGAAIVGFGLLILRNMMLKGQRDKARDNAKTYKAQAEQAQAIQKVDAEIELEYSDLEREAKKAIKNGEMPSNIRNRNSY
jgi:uncharacterized protein YjcR